MALVYHYDPPLFSPASAYCLETRVVAEKMGEGVSEMRDTSVALDMTVICRFIYFAREEGRREKGDVNRYPPPSVPTLLFAPSSSFTAMYFPQIFRAEFH